MMLEKPFSVGIYSREKLIFEGRAVSLVAPSVQGYLGVLANHAPLVAKLTRGKITLRPESGEPLSIPVPESGFLEVLANQATILLFQ